MVFLQVVLTVLVWEVVLDVLAEELVYSVTDLLLLLQDVLVILSVVSLGDGWVGTHTHTHTQSEKLKLKFIIGSKRRQKR